MDLNIISLFYLFFRLAPFIIVCYFSLSSIFNQDIKGLIYLGGLTFACIAAIVIGNVLGNNIETKNAVCNMITIGTAGSLSNIPLGIVVLTFTFFYLLYVIVKNGIVNYNLPTLVIFPVLIVGDVVWNYMNSCYTGFSIGTGVLIGSCIGILWSYVISSINRPNLLFLNVGDNQTVCQRPSKTLFKCTFAKDTKTTTPPP